MAEIFTVLRIAGEKSRAAFTPRAFLKINVACCSNTTWAKLVLGF
jgi:uncharacterized OsmC-like protein